MRKTLLLVFTATLLWGCAKSTVRATWDISARPIEAGQYELTAQLQRVKETTVAIMWVKVEVDEMNPPSLILKPGEQAADLIPEPDISRTMKSTASLDESGENITFEIVVEYDGETYSTNGIIALLEAP